MVLIISIIILWRKREREMDGLRDSKILQGEIHQIKDRGLNCWVRWDRPFLPFIPLSPCFPEEIAGIDLDSLPLPLLSFSLSLSFSGLLLVSLTHSVFFKHQHECCKPAEKKRETKTVGGRIMQSETFSQHHHLARLLPASLPVEMFNSRLIHSPESCNTIYRAYFLHEMLLGECLGQTIMMIVLRTLFLSFFLSFSFSHPNCSVIVSGVTNCFAQSS